MSTTKARGAGKSRAELLEEILDLRHKLDVANAKLSAMTALGGGFANAEQALFSLTLKQHAAMQLIFAGASNLEISQVFDCKESTAKVHVRGVMLKFGVRTRAHLILRAKPVFDKMDADQYEEAAGLPKDWAHRWHEKRLSRILDKLRAKKGGGT